MLLNENAIALYKRYDKLRIWKLLFYNLATAFLGIGLLTLNWKYAIPFLICLAIYVKLDIKPKEVLQLIQDVHNYVASVAESADKKTHKALKTLSFNLIIQGQGTARYKGYRITLTEGLLEITYGY